MDRHARESPSNPAVETGEKPVMSTFPAVVLDMMQRERETPPELQNDESRDIPPVDLEGGKMWEEFSSHATVLEKDLQRFQDAVKELGSSLELTGAARIMRKSLSVVSRLFQQNARNLFPRVVPPGRPSQSATGYNGRVPPSWPPVVNSQSNSGYQRDTRPMFVELKALASSIQSLRVSLERFLEFGDVEDLPLMLLEGDLKYWSSCLEGYEDQFETREVQQYIHDLSRELGAQFEDTSLCLRELIDSVPTVRLAQKNVMASLQNITTIATFFSAVTATTLQYSFQNNTHGVSKAVNLFWFNSLVFSIASALNSFLVLTWRRANYSSPQIHIPRFLWIWIRHCPPIFLLISVVTFLIGLGCFSLSSGQAHFTSVIVIASEAISAFGLGALLVWLAYDKWCFHRQRHGPWPSWKFAMNFRGRSYALWPTYREHGPIDALETVEENSKDSGSVAPLCRSLTEDKTTNIFSLVQRKEMARKRWHWVFRRLCSILEITRQQRSQELLETRRLDNLDMILSKFTISHQVPERGELMDTHDIQFDPSGRVLAICSDGLHMRLELEPAKIHECRHYIRQADQVVWTPSAEYLVTRNNNSIHVLLPSGDMAKPPITRENSCYILGLPNSDAGSNHPAKFLSVEGAQRDKLAIVDILGNEHMSEVFKNIWIRHVDISPDGTRAFIVAVMLHRDGDQPKKASLGHKLIAYKISDRKIEHEVPLWHDVQYVTISVDGRWAVVSYRDGTPPQLWLLRPTIHGIRLSLERQFYAREQTSILELDPNKQIRFSGRAHFIGGDQYIVCARADGKIYVWRRDKPHPVYVNGGLSLDKDKPVQIVCNRASNNFMFATRSYDGTVRIWNVHGEHHGGSEMVNSRPS